MKFISGWWEPELPLHSSWSALVSCCVVWFHLVLCGFIWFSNFPKLSSSSLVHCEIHIWLVRASSPITFVMVGAGFLWFHLVLCCLIKFSNFTKFSSWFLVHEENRIWLVKASSPMTFVMTCAGFLWFPVVSSGFVWFYLVFQISRTVIIFFFSDEVCFCALAASCQLF